MVALAEGVGVVTAANVVLHAFERHGHQHRAAMAVYDGLRQAGGAARIDNPQGVVKRQPERFEC